MSHCVPQWDAIEEELAIAVDSADLFSPTKGRCEPVQQRGSNFSPTTFEPGRGFEELCWDNGQLLVLKQSQTGKDQKQGSSHFNPSVVSHVSSRDNAFTPVGLRSHEKDGTLEAVIHDLSLVVNSSSSASCNDYLQDEELASWIQSQMNEPLYKYCPEMITNVLSRNSLGGQDHERLNEVDGQSSRSMVAGSLRRARNLGQASNAVVSGTGVCHSLSMNSDLAAGVGPSRAPGLISSSGTPDTLTRTPCPVQSPAAFKQANVVYSASCSSGWSTSSITTSNKEMTLSPMPPPNPHSGDARSHCPPPRKTTVMNFSHFSRPAAAFKANLRTVVGVSDGPTSANGGWKRLGRSAMESSLPVEPSIQSIATGMDSLASKRDEMPLFNSTSLPSPPLASGQHRVQSSLFYNKKAANEICADNDTVNWSVKAVEQCSRGDCSLASDIGSRTEKGAELREVPESTVASSGGSGNNPKKCKKVDNSIAKRKTLDIEDSECQSGDPEEEPADARKLRPPRSASAKRSRAAEIHNQSERRRRDRINERLRALQELIPNSNKTDKASLLEEAIEYLKMLQTQLQEMSYRSGINVSPMLIPPGIQHFQMPQMASAPHMAMAMGMGMGVGMVDINAATAARHALPWESLPSPAIPLCAVSALPVPAVATVPGSILATIPGSTLPATVIPTPLPVSALPGMHISMPSPCVIVPTSTVSIANHHNVWTTNDFNLITNQQLQITSQPAGVNLYNTLVVHQPHTNFSSTSAPP